MTENLDKVIRSITRLRDMLGDSSTATLDRQEPDAGLLVTEAEPDLEPEPDPEPEGNRLTAYDPHDAPVPEGEFTPVGIHVLADGVVDPYVGFIHPVSGQPFPLAPGDRLLQHMLIPESFAVIDADGRKKFTVNKLGKKYAWPKQIPMSNFKVVYTETVGSTDYDPEADALPDARAYIEGDVFTHPISGLEVEIGPGEILMQHNFTPHSYLIMGTDGSMQYKIDAKGKKQKAGNNLRAQNYHEVLRRDPVDTVEIQDWLDQQPVGTVLRVDDAGAYMTKQPDGSWLAA